jgi:hypothetical protein
MPRSMFGCFVKAQSDLDWAFSYGADSHKPKLKIQCISLSSSVELVF